MKSLTKLVVLGLAAAIALPTSAQAEDEALVFDGVRILDGTDAEPRTGTVVVVGERIGGVTNLPSGATRIEFEGGYVTPGLIDIAARTGYRGRASERTREMTPALDVGDLIDIGSTGFEEAARAGVTSVVVVPAPDNVLNGLGRAYVTQTASGRAAAIDDAPQPLHVTLATSAHSGNFPPRSRPTDSIFARRPTTRMGTVWMLRQSFLVAKGEQERPNDADLTPLEDVLSGKRRLRLACHRYQDMSAAMRLMDEAGIPGLVFEGAEEAYAGAEELARRKIDVIAGPFPSETATGGPDFTDTALTNVAQLHDAGVRVALTGGSAGPDDLRTQAILAVRHGLPRQVALAAVTRTAAELAGLEGRGTLDTGSHADLVLWSGDPLEPTTRALVVVIGGRIVMDRRQEFGGTE